MVFFIMGIFPTFSDVFSKLWGPVFSAFLMSSLTGLVGVSNCVSGRLSWIVVSFDLLSELLIEDLIAVPGDVGV